MDLKSSACHVVDFQKNMCSCIHYLNLFLPVVNIYLIVALTEYHISMSNTE